MNRKFYGAKESLAQPVLGWGDVILIVFGNRHPSSPFRFRQPKVCVCVCVYTVIWRCRTYGWLANFPSPAVHCTFNDFKNEAVKLNEQPNLTSSSFLLFLLCISRCCVQIAAVSTVCLPIYINIFADDCN